MTSPSSAAPAIRGATSRAQLPGLALVLGWAGLALAAQGTALAVPTLALALASITWLAWMLREHGRRATAGSRGLDCAALTPLLDATLANDIGAMLAHGATLLGADRVWLRVEAPLSEHCLAWPPASGTEAPPWFDPSRIAAGPWMSDAEQAMRCALPLRQRDVRIGVLAFECASRRGQRAPRLLETATALAMLTTHMLLCLQLESRLAESNDQQARERRVFLAKLSHKLRTPMTAILGFAQILSLDDKLDGEHREFVREIETAGQTLLDMLNELVGVPRQDV